MSDQMSFPCPQCQRSVSADAWQALDLAKHSEWRQQLLQGQLQHLHCPHCQALALPFAVHDPIGEQVIFYIPEHLSLPPEMIPQIQGYLGNALMLAMDGPPPEYILNHALCRDAEELRALISDRSSEATPKPKTDRLLDFTDLRELLNELSQPARTPDMPRRVQLCRKALNLLSRGQDPQLWADLQGEFGNSLSQSPFGERAENLEQAIAAYQQALEVHTRATLPVKWAMTMQNLGGAYWKRLQGERGENLERSIAALQQVLEVFTQATIPIDWAMTMQNLGLVYLDRLRGEWAENLEQAMAALQQALEVYNRTALPVEWTGTMQNLGFVYTNCETGMTEFQHTPDEYIGLPTGFLQAGAPCVISTLWAVSDFTTTMLMERFYQNHLQKEMKIPEALRQAQLWLGI